MVTGTRRVTTLPRATSIEKGQLSPAKTSDARGLVASLPRRWRSIPLQSVPFLPSCSEPPDLQGLHHSARETTFPGSLCLPTAFSEKNQLCWARAKDKGTAKHLPAGASAPLLLSPAEAPREQRSIGRKQHFWSAMKTLPRGHFS